MTTDNTIEVKLNTLDKNLARFRSDETVETKLVVGYNQVEKTKVEHHATVTIMRSVWEEMGSPKTLKVSLSE